ncbi:hypothetical protein ACFOD9_12255 [Novosphingobium bradum]|uniref:Uncharacterized protein n=1 Tax=Novosphingobium bradum TaxID=1737444 RepID=A0ABV7IQT7_9SPHN
MDGTVMLIAFVITAFIIAVLIVGPGQVVLRLAQWAGALVVMAGASLLMMYVVPIVMMIVLGLAAFAGLVALFVYLFGLPGSSGGSAGVPRIGRD